MEFGCFNFVDVIYFVACKDRYPARYCLWWCAYGYK